MAQIITSLIDLPLELKAGVSGTVSVRMGRRLKLPLRLICRSPRPLTWATPQDLTLSYRWFNLEGGVMDVADIRTQVPQQTLQPNTSLTFTLDAMLPSIPGEYNLQVSLLLEQVHWACDVTDTGWTDVAVKVLPPIAWPEELKTSQAGKALRGAIVAAELRRNISAAEEASKTAILLENVPREDEDAHSTVQTAEQAGRAELDDEERDELMALVSKQQKQINELLTILHAKERRIEELETTAEAQPLPQSDERLSEALEALHADLRSVVKEQSSIRREFTQGPAMSEITTAVRQLTAWTETTRDLSKLAPIGDGVIQARDLLTLLTERTAELHSAMDTHVEELATLFSERSLEQRSAMDWQHKETLLKLDALLRRQMIHVPQVGLMLIRNFAGLLAVQDNDVQAIAYYSSGELPEPGTVAVVQQLLKEGDYVVDVGANVGAYTLLAARLVGPTGRVIAIEPTPSTVHALRTSIALNGLSNLVETHALALGRSDGEGELHCEATSGHNSLLPSASGGTESVAVEVKRGDTLLKQLRPALIKIDVEGWELDVLEGLGKLITGANGPSLVIEYSPEHVARRGMSRGEWLERLRGYGLAIWKIDDATGKLVSNPDKSVFGDESFNLFLARKLPSGLKHMVAS